jgi:hypothetical protein
VSENEVVSFGRHVTSEAGFMKCLVARFSVLKVIEPPNRQPLRTFPVGYGGGYPGGGGCAPQPPPPCYDGGGWGRGRGGYYGGGYYGY